MIDRARLHLTPQAVTAASTFVVVAIVHLVAQSTGPGALRTWTQVVAMPLLALTVALASRAPRSRLVRWTLVGLGLSWLGDSAPKIAGDNSFLVMVGFFLLAQIAYVIAFWPARSRSAVRPGSPGWPLPLLGYGIALMLLLAACLPGAGELAVPVVLYGLVIVTMAVLATGIHPAAGAGAAIFVLSDALIALDAFTGWWELPWQGLAVMSTYLVAQSLIVVGVLLRDRTEA